MDVISNKENIGNDVIQSIQYQLVNWLDTQPQSDLRVKEAIKHIEKVKSSIPSVMDYEELKKIIEDVAPRLEDVGIFFSFDKIGEVPVVKVKDISGKVIKVFPKEEIAELVNRIRLFFEVLTELLLNRKV